MKKFKVGDKARVVYIRNGSDPYWRVGIVVIILAIEKGKTLNDMPYECIVELKNGRIAEVLFDQLEPIVPEGTSWADIEAEFGWNPTKAKVKEKLI